ncbi:MAG: aminomethyl-transferring glycine dehydrogenase [Xanthomonadaceae bacterium]|nr:aminomethyl-transferring glycine dehydrogenase [Xanthomonadaceae bacterium]
MKFEQQNFASRHLGIGTTEEKKMTQALGLSEINELIEQAVPRDIALAKKVLDIPKALSESDALNELRRISKKNQVTQSHLGQGYYDTITPSVIQRTILENPGWYTQYTPYQAEIAQGRLEALLNFQTMISDLTALPISNASLLDEATAAAEAVNLCFYSQNKTSDRPVIIDQDIFEQTVEVIKTRTQPLGIKITQVDTLKETFSSNPLAIVLQYPKASGKIENYEELIKKAKQSNCMVIMICDLLSLALLKPPGELGADIAVGTSQRFGVPMGFGGPHAAYMSTKDDFKRLIPGRIVGVSKDAQGKTAYRLALQTREQHIRREKASSNICTAQVLLAIISSMYAVYHGPEGIKQIASRVHEFTALFALVVKKFGFKLKSDSFFDTIELEVGSTLATKIKSEMERRSIRAYWLKDSVRVSFDETTTKQNWLDLASCFAVEYKSSEWMTTVDSTAWSIPASLSRQSKILVHPVFNSHHSETKLLRYIKKLEAKDLSLTQSMIPLGSCTMKLNAASELYPISWPEFSKMHPFAPSKDTVGYIEMIKQLEAWLSEITGFAGASLQPNAGSQGEYAGLLVIKKYHETKGQKSRNICLIPKSAHGTNPASAIMAGLEVVAVECDENGNVDISDLEKKAKEHEKNLSALMITYPSTHGVFEKGIKKICQVVHTHGGQVYMDGANMNAQVGLCRPGDFGPDVCHLNLHKTFCIPHGGGGPGMGPICVAKHLVEFLPGHTKLENNLSTAASAVSAAPYGSASILPISWMYIRMMGPDGLKRATEVAILNANYIASKLDAHFPVLYKGDAGRVAHECIIDLRALKISSGIEVEDVAKRLMDYGFHAPTVSFPVPGTMMIEPTESESLDELDRFCEAMIKIRQEIGEIEKGSADKKNNLLKNSPHVAQVAMSENWNYPYSRERAIFPVSWLKDHKFWPSVSRIDNVFGDRNLVCSCPSMDSYT